MTEGDILEEGGGGVTLKVGDILEEGGGGVALKVGDILEDGGGVAGGGSTRTVGDILKDGGGGEKKLLHPNLLQSTGREAGEEHSLDDL